MTPLLRPSGEGLRVLFLTPYFRPYLGGIEWAIEQLSFQLMRSSSVESVGVLTTKCAFPRIPHPQWPDRETTPRGIAIFRLNGYPARSLPLYSVPLVWFSPWQIRCYLREFTPNLIHFVGDGWFWGHLWVWLAYRRRARFIFTPSFNHCFRAELSTSATSGVCCPCPIVLLGRRYSSAS